MVAKYRILWYFLFMTDVYGEGTRYVMLTAGFTSVEELDDYVVKGKRNSKLTLAAGAALTVSGIALDLITRKRGKERTIPLTELGALVTALGVADTLDMRDMATYQEGVHAAVEDGCEPLPDSTAF